MPVGYGMGDGAGRGQLVGTRPTLEEFTVRFNTASFWRASVLVAAAGLCLVPTSTLLARQDAAQVQPEAAPVNIQTAEWAGNLWRAAKSGDEAAFEQLLAQIPVEATGTPAALTSAAVRLREHYANREADRAVRIEEVRAEIAKHLAGGQGITPLSKALVSAMELSDLVKDKQAYLAEPGTIELISKSDTAANDAERAGKWLDASELFVRLQLLLEETPKGQVYKEASSRLGHRLAMLRLYTPERLWELQNQRRMESEGKPLPPYNALGGDFKEKLDGIAEGMVKDALARSAQGHVDKNDMKAVVLGAIDGVRTLVTTPDLAAAFPGLRDEAQRNAMLVAVDEEEKRVRADRDVNLADLDRVMRRLAVANDSSVKIHPAAFLHEFGNGGMGALDEFSAIVWPYEIARFNKMIAGNFAGIGVHIEFDEASNVKVVSPIEGSPAHRAGIKSDDLIVKVEGKSVYGLPIDGVVDLITGKRGTPVRVTVERKTAAAEGQEPTKEEIEFALERNTINVASIKGWRRTGVKEHDWDWFVDDASKVAYIRILNFTDETGKDLAKAVHSSRQQGAKGLILDLRFNPGGLLDQGIEVAQQWVDEGSIVLTRSQAGVVETAGKGDRTASLAELPTVVLVNRGSASASEIVAGALQYYGNRGDLPVVVLGQRTYGKGSVQQVYDMRRARLKLTSQYYLLPDQRLVHRKPGASVWGVDPNLDVEMLPKQIGDAITLRKSADILPGPGVTPANPDELLTKNLDLQLEAAMVLLEAQSYAGGVKQANAGK
jgi:carboxyl-terminal processing protease